MSAPQSHPDTTQMKYVGPKKCQIFRYALENKEQFGDIVSPLMDGPHVKPEKGIEYIGLMAGHFAAQSDLTATDALAQLKEHGAFIVSVTSPENQKAIEKQLKGSIRYVTRKLSR